MKKDGGEVILKKEIIPKPKKKFTYLEEYERSMIRIAKEEDQKERKREKTYESPK